MRTLVVSSFAAVGLAVGLYFAFGDVIFPAPGAPVEELRAKIGGSGFDRLAPMLRPSDELDALDDLDFILSPETPFEFADTRGEAVRLPGELLAAIRAGDRRAFPIEVAALAAASLRSRAHGRREAKVMEVTELEGVVSPDPAGRFGYYVVELDGDVFDVFGARAGAEVKRGRVLTDLEAIAAAGAVDAMVAASRAEDPARALRMAKRAHELDPKSPSIRAIEGTILMVSGQMEEGQEELEAALELSPDPARKNIVAGLKLAMGDIAGATRLVDEALEGDPELGPAYVTRAGLELSRGDLRGARVALLRAEAIDPGLPALAVLFAQLDLAENDPASAKRRILAEIERFPDDAQTHMAAVQVFQAAGDFDGMRRSVQAVLRLSPPAQRPMLEEQIRAVFGPSALMQPLDEGIDDDDEPAPSLELRLDAPSDPFGDEFKLKEPGVEQPSSFRLELGD